ncbi:hypothetical protein [Massilia sp. Se16.2.3]|uniref:hypothetical protein n=1 Tax=Massilia sp. Se16.2.3 TaxID=2709303 RepID=UPI0015FF2D6E|nr:hypothetical protein [Massilia sp. Se16.2.3]QNB00181.1 hypothetical protein G4G31_17440 [Massilia sp. Se16.2.3]
MPNLNWFLPLDACHSLDELTPQWHALLEQHRMTPACDAERYADALLAFVGMSTLSPHLKLSAVLAFGSAFDIDLRLAIGALAEQTGKRTWPGPTASQPASPTTARR